MGKIGIVCASDTELAPFLPHLENTSVTEIAMLKFYEGTLGKVPVVAVYSGVCKVNAAIAAQILIDRFPILGIINAGTAGGLEESIQLFDTVVSEMSAYHDVADDILTEFHPWLQSVFFPSNETLLAIARQYSARSQYPIRFGRTGTGEQFVTDHKREEIKQRFSPLSTDMETASIAHVCYVNRVPFLAIRTITDTAEHKGMDHFAKNCTMASEISAHIVMALIQELRGTNGTVVFTL